MENGAPKVTLGAICAKWSAKFLYLLGYVTQNIPWSLLNDLVPPLNGALSLIEVDLAIFDDNWSSYSLYGYIC